MFQLSRAILAPSSVKTRQKDYIFWFWKAYSTQWAVPVILWFTACAAFAAASVSCRGRWGGGGGSCGGRGGGRRWWRGISSSSSRRGAAFTTLMRVLMVFILVLVLFCSHLDMFAHLRAILFRHCISLADTLVLDPDWRWKHPWTIAEIQQHVLMSCQADGWK